MPHEPDRDGLPPHPGEGEHRAHHARRAHRSRARPGGGDLGLRPTGPPADGGDRSGLPGVRGAVPGADPAAQHPARRLRRGHRRPAGHDPPRHRALLAGGSGRRVRCGGGQGPVRWAGTEYLQPGPGGPGLPADAVAVLAGALCRPRRGAAPVGLRRGGGHLGHPAPPHADARSARNAASGPVPGQCGRLHRGGLCPGAAPGRSLSGGAKGHFSPHFPWPTWALWPC